MHARESAWQRIAGPWDLLVIGGGITGAGILHEAASHGLRALLVERGDFASGTSSRSSKLIHGGLRYIREGKIALTRESIRERERLLHDAPGLVEPLSFLMPHYSGRKPGRALLGAGLAIYDLLGGSWKHRFVDAQEAVCLVPALRRAELTGAHVYGDATTDDARLVQRILQEAQQNGAVAVNYVEATGFVRRGAGVAGANVVDRLTGKAASLAAHVVINATGASADVLRASVGESPKLRPLRGSHVLISDWRLPLAQAVAFSHPHDGRPVFAYPWCGMTLVGTTDLDHDGDLRDEPSISRAEVEYLLEALDDQFPESAIVHGDIVSTYAGVRPVVASGVADPSKESRDQMLLEEHGLITMTGGKLTTFRPMAVAAVHAAMKHLPKETMRRSPSASLRPAALPTAPALSWSARRRLAGRFGARAQAVVDGARDDELTAIGGSDTLWAELRYACAHEQIVHLDDLLLRRTRIGLLFRDGGVSLLPRIRACSEALGWDERRWQTEASAYRALWQRHYGVPDA
ncbi:MAG: glycerol-3-phosphate dehydrogenase/oxidase [Vulcanimicrobiaceae bacterium]